MIILIIGDFGVGKDTVADMCVDILGDEKAHKIKSYTTRDPRYPEEDTHTFISVEHTFFKSKKCFFKDVVLNSGKLVAYTQIDNEFYWTEIDQFFQKPFEFYVTDNKGAAEVVYNIREVPVMIIKIDRPQSMIDVEEERLNRTRSSNNPDIPPTIFFRNDTDTLEQLRDNVEVLCCAIKRIKEENE